MTKSCLIKKYYRYANFNIVIQEIYQNRMRKSSLNNSKKISYNKLLKLIWSLFFIVIISALLFFIFLSNGLIVDLPNTKQLENPRLSLTTVIMSTDDVVIGRFFKENRSQIDYVDIPQNLIDALISTEDERYYQHSGIDYKAVARAITKLGTDGGGSTITQQLAKMLFSEKPKNKHERIIQKFGEWVIAIQLEKRFTKEEIISLYLNKFEFYGSAVVGLNSGAKLFFNKKPQDLNIEESAVLVGMLKSPLLYNPKKKPNNALKRRNTVLGQMVKNKKLSKEDYDSLKYLPIKLKYTKFTSKLENIKYFRENLKNDVNKIFKNRNIKKKDGSEYNLYTDGLKIYTTIDSRIQKNAENAVKKHLALHQKKFNSLKKTNKNFPFYGNSKQIENALTRAMKLTNRYKLLKMNNVSEDSIKKSFNTPILMDVFTWNGTEERIMSPMDSIKYHKSILQTGLMSMEPQTGYVKAWVGGVDFNHFKYDHVKLARRQIGSTFKPFVYSTAISEKHYSPCTLISNESFTYPGSEKTVKGVGGEVSIKNALARSLNPVALRLIQKTTPKPVIQLARDLGVTSNIPNNLTIALGTADVSLYEMVGAYGAFANKGIYIKPVIVWRIEDKDGRILYENKHETKEVLSEQVAYTMLKIMKGPADHERGTAKRIRYKYGIKNPIACKTGTTNSNSDGWFIGIVPNLVTGIWVGHEDRIAHFKNTKNGQGAAMALPIWAYYMKDNYKNKKLGISNQDFTKPLNDSVIDFNCIEHKKFEAHGEQVKEVPNEIDINTKIQQNNDNLFD